MDAREFAAKARRFVMPPRMTVSRPRAVRLSAAGVALLIVSLAMFTGAIVSFVLLSRESARQTANRRLLVTEGMRTDGAVARLWKDGDNRRRVEYRFVADGRPYVGRANVPDAVRRTLQVGAPIVVRYVPTNARLNDLGGNGRSGMPAAIAPIAAVFLTSVGGLCLYALERQRQLLMDGRVAPGVVTGQRKAHNSHGGDRTVIEYEFQILSGAIRRGSTTPSSKPPAIGTVVCVVYDPDRPGRQMIYPFSLVAPAQG